MCMRGNDIITLCSLKLLYGGIPLPFIYALLFLFVSASPYVAYFRDGEGSVPFLAAVSVLYLLSLAVFLINKKSPDKFRSSATISYLIALAFISIAGGLVRGFSWGPAWGFAWGFFSVFFSFCFLLLLHFMARVKSGWDNMV